MAKTNATFKFGKMNKIKLGNIIDPIARNFFKKAILAVTGCESRGLCMYGCPEKAILNSKNLFLGRVITLIGKRTYGIFFAHFLFLQSPLLLEFYDRFNITGFGLLFKILDFFIVLFFFF
jgi:hypothetical protein